MKKRLMSHLIVGGIVLSGFSFTGYSLFRQLTSPNFENANWASVPASEAGIWKSYTSEDIVHSERNWDRYQEEVARRNGFEGDSGYVEFMDNFSGTSVILPDLDRDIYVTSGDDRHPLLAIRLRGTR